MSRPYQQNPLANRFPANHQAADPSSRPLASTQPDGTPTSYKTNVNRAKTRRWVEAKSYSYDGDDWGDVDDYDEYGGYDEPVQAKPTGLRQQGQTVWSRNASGYNAVNRSNSFDQGDEGQAFSAGGPQQYSNPSPYDLETNQAVQSQRNQGYAQEQPQHQQPYSSGPPAGSIQSKSSMEGQMALGHTHPPPANYRGVSYSDQPRQPGNNSRSQSMTSNTSSLDFHGRRDFTPSAMPPPLHTRASPAPQDPSEFIPPPRKSSLSQQKIRHTPTAGDNAPNAQEQGPYSNNTATSSIRDSEESNPSKPLPFVRPADIYRRMQEEREKERQSQESSRPSMNAIMNEQPPVPDSRGTPAEEQSRMDNSMGPSLGRKKSFETDKGELGSRRLNSSLQPVAERKSEYGMDDRPLLPDVTRISGFGESFLNTVGNEVTESQRSNSRNTNEPQTSMSPIHRNTEDLSLRNQPSLGFRSVVHQAFDRQDDQIPQTPSSLSGSAVARSNSESTNGISPIISRAPSTTNAEVRAREAEAREANIPRIIEEPGEAASRRSSSNTLGTAKSVTRKAHPSQSPRHDSSNSVPTSFIPGHRRDISTPSPDNSPARTPALEASSQLRQPQEAELAVTTPIEPNMSDRSFPSDAISYGEQRPSMPYDGYSEAQPPPVTRSGTAGKSMVDVQNPSKIDTTINATQEPMSPLRSFNQPGSSVTFFDSPTGRAESPSKSKVRDLAGKFEGVAGSRHGSEQSLPLPISMSSSIPKLEDPFIPRPGNDRMQSFRPHLPGGWESYASNAPVRQGTPLMSEGTISTGIPMKADHVKVEGRDVSHVPNEDIDITPTTDKRTPSESPQKEEPENPFSAVATAGSALAGALVAAMGMNQDKPSPQPEDFNRPRGRSASSKDAEVHPEAFRPSHTAVDDSVSSVEPTPLAKNTPQSLGQSPTSNPDYFPPVVPLRAKPRNILTQEDEPARPVRPQFLPSLSTDPSPQDYESDRLRKEIVRELSPHAEQFEDTQSYNTSAPQVRPSRLSVNQAFKGHGHDSIALPSEYESYWNGSTSEDEASRPTSQQVPDTSVNARVPEPPKHDSEFARHISNETEPSASSSDRLQVRPAALVHRFSWEPEPEEINAQQQPLLQAGRDIASEGQIGDAPEISSSPVIQPPEQPVVNEDPPVKTRQALGISPVEEALNGTIPPAPIEEALRSSVSQHSEMRPHTAGSESHGRNEHMPAEDRYNIWPSAEQKNNQIQGDIDTPTPTNRIELPLPPLPQNAQTKIPAFREILALKTAQERIQTYNATREQFANMNTGLEDWMTATLDELPEHAALVNNGGQFTAGAYSHKPSLSRGKLAGLRISSLQPLQQPYYQQYLNASSQPTGSSPATGGPTTPGNASSHPHAGSSGGKLSSHHVQAKGKDLLQSAGKFGGKANVAAKGLFSKGKSKFRGGGGGDKTPISSFPNPDPSRRGMQATSQAPPQVLPQIESEGQRVSPPIQSDISLDDHTSNLPSIYRLSSHLPRSRPVSSVFPNDHATSTQDRSHPIPHSEEGQHSPAPSNDSTRPRALSQLAVNPNDTEPGRSFRVPEPEPAVIGDGAPIFLKETPSAESYIGTAGPQSPLSTTSSNRTPTQSSFGRSQWLNEIMPSGSSAEPPIPKDSGLKEARYGVKTLPETSADLEPVVRENSRTVHELQGGSSPIHGIENTSDHVYKKEVVQDQQINPPAETNRATSSRVSEDSEGTYQTADSGQDPILQYMEPSTPKPSNVSVQQVPLSSSSIRDSSPVKHMPQQSDDGSHQLSTQVQLRPFSFIEYNKAPSARHSEDDSYREPSLDNSSIIPSQDRPPSPVSPQQSDFSQPSQPVPVHYNINHDFRPESTQEFTTRPRPRSFSRPFQDPNLRDHPAFRQENFQNPTEPTDPPAQYYPSSLNRDEAMLPRQQNTEYSLEGVGPPADETNFKSRSCRGSRSSAFFKRLSRPPSDEIPAMPAGSDEQPSLKTPVSAEKKKRRASLFRTLTGRSGSDSSRSKEREVPLPSRSRTDLHPRSDNGSSSPSEKPGILVSKEVSVRTRTKLHRSSTSGTASQESGSKKRFSGIGSLFSRSSRRQPSVLMPEPQSAYSRTQSEQGTAFSQQQSFHRHQDGPPLPRQDSLYFASHQVPSAPPPGYLQRLPDHVYDRPPLEGYYSPDRRSGTEETFSPGSMIRQRSPRPIPQNQGPPEQYQDEHQQGTSRPSSHSWDQLLNPTIRNVSPKVPDGTSQYGAENPQPVRGSSLGPAFSHGDQIRYSSNKGPDIGIAFRNENSSWIRSPDRRSNNSSSNLSPVSTLPSVNSNPAHATSRGPLRSSMKKPRGYHEVEGMPSGRTESPPPPPPPPKDEWFTQSVHRTGPLHSRSSSYNPPLPSNTYPKPAINPYRQSLPLLQTNMNYSRDTPQEAKSTTPEDIRRSRQRDIERGNIPSGYSAGGHKSDDMAQGTDGEERIVMSSSSYPGQEWQPDYGHYEGH